ncbi:MAG: 16S rRNA (uracil(1498)-N(3))-methyltransferase [Christensenellales bacterium]
MPKADKMEWIVQKSTELGAAAIAPVAMIRSVVKLEGKMRRKRPSVGRRSPARR